MKKLKYLIFTLILTFIALCNIDALTCAYQSNFVNELEDIYYIQYISEGNVRIFHPSPLGRPDPVSDEKLNVYIHYANGKGYSEHYGVSLDIKNYKIKNYEIGIYKIEHTGGAKFELKNKDAGLTIKEVFKAIKSCPTVYINDNLLTETSFPQQKIDTGSCAGYLDKTSCKKNDFYSCVWNENEYGEYCNTDNLLFVACGDAKDIPYQAPKLISFFVNLLKIATPIILVIVSIISLLKALSSQKEDEIKKAQSSLIKKLIAAVMVFFIITIVQFVISKVALDDEEYNSFTDCLSCFLNNDCEDNIYYRTNIDGDYHHYNLVTGQEISELAKTPKS